jgi:hypothetical protein
MKTTLAVLMPLASLVVLALAATARADTRNDVETDHLDGFDDGGPRRFAVLVNPVSAVLATFGAEGDLGLGDTAALSLEAIWAAPTGTDIYGAVVGLHVFPGAVPFHGLYIHPRLEGWRATADGARVVLGLGCTVGWEWTWRFGLTARAGLGATYERALTGSDGSASSLVGVRPLLDGLVGWAF